MRTFIFFSRKLCRSREDDWTFLERQNGAMGTSPHSPGLAGCEPGTAAPPEPRTLLEGWDRLGTSEADAGAPPCGGHEGGFGRLWGLLEGRGDSRGGLWPLQGGLGRLGRG